MLLSWIKICYTMSMEAYLQNIRRRLVHEVQHSKKFKELVPHGCHFPPISRTKLSGEWGTIVTIIKRAYSGVVRVLWHH
jgi:phage terminase large subunit-like protein